MNKNVCLLTSLLAVVLCITNQRCRSDKNAPTPYTIEPTCFYQEFTYIGSINQVKAKVVKTEPGEYDLLTDQPVLIDTTHHQTRIQDEYQPI